MGTMAGSTSPKPIRVVVLAMLVPGRRDLIEIEGGVSNNIPFGGQQRHRNLHRFQGRTNNTRRRQCDGR
jgi:hypothetical protein